MKPFKPSSKIFLLTVPRRYHFCGSFSVNNILFKYKVHRDTTDTSYIQYKTFERDTEISLRLVWICFWIICVMFMIVVFPDHTHILFLIPFHVLSWVRCFTWLYRFLIFAAFLTLREVPNGMETIFPHYEISFDYVHFLWRTCVNV